MRSAKADATARKAPRIGYPVPMQPRPQLLLNSDEIELWPAWLLRARANADARALAHGCWLLRRKRDGRYLATLDRAGGVRALVPGLMREPGLAAALRWRQRRAFRDARAGAPPVALPMHALAARLAALGLDAQAYAACSGLAPVPEPEWLAFAGFDRYRRPLWLHTQAARAWNGLQAAACADGIALDAISGYRSHAYQLGIFARKRARGLRWTRSCRSMPRPASPNIIPAACWTSARPVRRPPRRVSKRPPHSAGSPAMAASTAS